MKRISTIICALTASLLWGSLASLAVCGDDPAKTREDLKEPILRIAKATAPKTGGHPLDPALDLARNGLKIMQESVQDYTCTMVKRERIDGKLGDYEYMFTKIRNRKLADGKLVTPFSVYMYFLKPTTVKGREVLYIEGQNSDKMIAHEAPNTLLYKTVGSVWLKPDGAIAMRGQLYPVTDSGIENLVLKLIERGEKEKANGNRDCEVTFHENAKINGRTCTLLQIKHPEPGPGIEFHLAHVFIDNELTVPVRYASYGFPVGDSKDLPILEEYTYLDIKLNVGLTDADFDHKNAEYKFE